MELTLNGKRIKVVSIAEAQLKVHEAAMKVGATRFYTRNPIVGCPVTSGGELLGHIPYNSNFWPATDSDQDPPPTEGGNMNAKIKKSKTPVPAAKKPLRGRQATPAEVEAIENAKPVVDEAPAAEPEAPVEAAADPTPEPKARKGRTAKPKPEGEQKPTPPPAEDGLVVFALRMTLPERELLHATAGPAKASRFARMILNAAANRDVDKLREIVEATRTAS